MRPYHRRGRAPGHPWWPAAFLLLLVPAAVARAADNVVIRAIEIKAGPGVDEARLRAHMRIHVGDLYRPDAVRQEIHRLWEADKLRTLDIETETVADGVKLTVIAGAWPRITAIEWQGELGLSRRQLADKTAAKVGDVASGYLLKTDERAVEDALRQEGFHFATVRQESVAEGAGIRVVYHVAAGPRVRVEAVQFEGNHAFTDSQLHKLLATKEGGLFSYGAYDPATFQDDLQSVARHYRDNGWLNVTVGHRLTYDETHQHLYPLIQVHEGERYQVDRVSVELRGDKADTTEAQILAALRLRAGAFFTEDDLRQDRETVNDMYGRLGRVWTTVEVERSYAPEGPTLGLRYIVTVGQVVYIERVDILGNEVTQDHVIRRDITLIPGRRASTVELKESRRRLLNTGLFATESPTPPEEAVRIHFERGRADDQAVAVVEVREGPKGNIQLGFGYSTVQGFTGLFEVRHNNFDALDFPKSFGDFFSGDAFAGGGQSLSLRLMPGANYKDYRLIWRNPSVYDSPWSTGFDAFIRDFQAADYHERREGLSLTVGRALLPRLRLNVTPSWERIRISHIDTDAAADIQAVAGGHTRNAVTVGLVYDQRDSRFFPTQGYLIQGDVTLAGTVFGGDVDVIKESLGAQHFWTVWNPSGWGKHVVQVGGELALVQPTRDGPVPIFERYYAGGPGTIRGFEYRGIGPIDPLSRDHIGANTRLVASAEYSVPIYRDIVRTHVFIDGGQLAKTPGDLTPSDLSVAAGFGFRLRLLGGPASVPFSFDFGFPVIRQEHDATRVFNFNIGTGFAF